MTILFFSRLFSPHIGGVEKHVLEISKRFIKDGHSVAIVTENYSWPVVERVEGIKVYRVDVGRNEFLKKFRMWWWLTTHMHIMKDADVVHCHDVFIWYMPFALLMPMKNVYTTFHGYEGNNIPGLKAKLMHKIAAFMSNGNISVGKFLEKWYGTKATYVTYGAVDQTQKSKLKSQNYNSKLKIVFVGRLEEETGIMEYLRAIKLLKEKHVKVTLTVLGDGSQRTSCEKYVAANKLNVSFLGFVKNPKQYMQHASIVFTSRYLGILEALAAKKYVIAVYNNKIKKDYLTMTPFAKYMWIEKNATGIVDAVLQMKNKKTFEKVAIGYVWAKGQTWEKLVSLYTLLWSSASLKKGKY